MSDKDLLASLAMIVPSFLLLSMIAFTLVRSDEAATADSGEGYVHRGVGTEKSHDGRDAPVRAKPQVATQKLMRDPWEKTVYAKTSRAPQAVQCDSSISDLQTPCFYW